ncbi:MAG: nuclear transport factor 2 family protein [Sphingomicrobium sp.]
MAAPSKLGANQLEMSMRSLRRRDMMLALGLAGALLASGCASDQGLRLPAAGDAAHAADERAIRMLRADNNRAIAVHDLAHFSTVFADDAVFVWSNGGSAVGKEALTRDFASDFAEPGFVTYVRSPYRVTVSANGARAVEHGTWTGLKRQSRYGGDYSAHWAKTPAGWRVRGELYVRLYCSGPLCTP